jgi:hypothetical protein
MDWRRPNWLTPPRGSAPAQAPRLAARVGVRVRDHRPWSPRSRPPARLGISPRGQGPLLWRRECESAAPRDSHCMSRDSGRIARLPSPRYPTRGLRGPASQPRAQARALRATATRIDSEGFAPRSLRPVPRLRCTHGPARENETAPPLTRQPRYAAIIHCDTPPAVVTDAVPAAVVARSLQQS